METKICTICHKELPIEDFNWRDKKKGTRRSECKHCHTKYMQDSIAKKREFASQVKEQLGCAKCGETRPYVLDFHHLDPSEKENTVSRLITNTSNIEKAKKEMAKCVVLCSNCHREFHYLNDLNPDFTLNDYLNS